MHRNTIRHFWQKNRSLLIPLLAALLIKLFSLNPALVERWYATGIYPALARVQRILLGWLPLSMGDLLYCFLAGYIIYKTFRFFRRLFKRQFTRPYVYRQLRAFVIFFAWLYTGFYLLWGLNYSRRGIAWQLQLDVQPYSTTQLAAVIEILKTRLHENAGTTGGMMEMKQKRRLFSLGAEAFAAAAEKYPFLALGGRSVKPSLFSYAGNYLGFLGYYNPFSGEAQVNTTVPVFLQPNITCHEMAHQAGYAKENEANFVGYLAARTSSDRRFRYSAYFDLFQYAYAEMTLRDTAMARQLLNGLHPQVISDTQELIRFRKAHKNPVEQLVQWLYGHYLKANSMPNGVDTYNEVVAWLIAFYKKMGADAV